MSVLVCSVVDRSAAFVAVAAMADSAAARDAAVLASSSRMGRGAIPTASGDVVAGVVGFEQRLAPGVCQDEAPHEHRSSCPNLVR
jgi:hypothetical protein